MLRFWPVRATTDHDDDTLLQDDGPASPLPERPGPPPSGELGAVLEALPRGCALLVMSHGLHADARYLLDGDVTGAGRSPRQDIMLDDATVSRDHAEFVRRGEGFAVRDLYSLNGTYVGGERVTEAVLRPGDVVRIGKFRLVYHPAPGRGPGRHLAVPADGHELAVR